jgi:acyl-coenzyme A synthetase/AMP-(fatty) acid ligase
LSFPNKELKYTLFSVNYSSLCLSVLLFPFFRTVAHALDAIFEKGDPIAIDMPMTCNAVIIYLAIILGGFVVVSIADSFAPQEIGSRMGVSKAKAIFTQVRD